MFSLADTPSNTRFNRAFLFLFAVLYLLAPVFYQDNPGGEGLFLPFNNTVWIAACFVITLGCLKVLQERYFLMPRLGLAIIIFPIIVTVMGSIFSVALPVSWMFRMLAIWGGVLLFFSINQFRLDQRWQDNLVFVVALSSLIQAIIGTLHLTLPHNLGGFIPFSLGVPRGIFQQVNINASYTATGLLAAIFCLTRPSFRRRPKWLRGLIFITIGLDALIVATSGSRIGLLGLLIGLAILLLARYRQLLKTPKISFTAIGCVVLAVILSTQVESESGGLRAGIDKFEQMSQSSADPTRNDVRWMMYDSSIELFFEQPWLGYGIGRFEPVWHDKKAQYLIEHPDAAILEPRLSHPHNELLYWGIEGGLLALSGILIAAGALLVTLWRLGIQRGGAYLALLTPIVLHTQVELPLYISQLHWLLLITLIALIASHHRTRFTLPISRYARAVCLGASLTLPVVATLFFSHTLVAGRINIAWEQTRIKDTSTLGYLEKNLFFNDIAAYKQMQTMVNYALQKDDVNVLRAYIPWASEYVKHTPELSVYLGLSMAYHRTGQFEEAYRVLDQALAIYPTGELANLGRRLLNGLDQQLNRPARYPEH